MPSPGSGSGTTLSRGRVATPSANCRGGHLGLCNAPPAIIGARVPEAYGAIMEPI